MKQKMIFAFVAGVLFSEAQSVTEITNLHSNDVHVMDDAVNQGGAESGVVFDATYNAYLVEDTVTWDASKNYILTAPLYIFDTDGNGDAELNIPAGTMVYSTGANAAPGSNEYGVIVSSRNAKLNATGTAEKPINFTTIRVLESERGLDMDGDGIITAPTLNDKGLWGGVILLGNGTVANYSSGTVGVNFIEGFDAADATTNDQDGDGFNDLITYGDVSPVDAESSGILTYVSISHGGVDLGSGNEINGLTLGGVGYETTIDYIEVLSNADDGVELFGGMVNLSHILVAYQKDDSLDIDEGYSGLIQYFVNIQNTDDTDSSGSAVPDSDHGGEWDGNKGGDLNDFISLPVITNFTLIGDAKSDHALKFDDFFAGEIYNGVITNFSDLLTVTADASLSLTAYIEGVITDVPNVLEGDNDAVEFELAGFITTVTDSELGEINTAEDFYDPTPISEFSAAYTAEKVDVAVIDSFLRNEEYVGAFAAGENWASSWTRFNTVFSAFEEHIDDDMGDDLGQIKITNCAFSGAHAFITFEAKTGVLYDVVKTDLVGGAETVVLSGVTDGSNEDRHGGVNSIITVRMDLAGAASGNTNGFYYITEQ